MTQERAKRAGTEQTTYRHGTRTTRQCGARSGSPQ